MEGMTHEQFIHSVRGIVADSLADATLRDRILHAKLVYGIGDGSYRGVCYFDAWKNGQPSPVELVEVSATGEESPVQLAGTTIHELGHVCAGKNAGHSVAWKDMCATLGLLGAMQSGHVYTPESFDERIREKIMALGTLGDGSPLFGPKGSTGFVGLPPLRYKPCPLGIGTKGGTSRGKGSGSRLRLYVCSCVNEKGKPSVKVRVASDNFLAHCDTCASAFKRVEKGGK